MDPFYSLLIVAGIIALGFGLAWFLASIARRSTLADLAAELGGTHDSRQGVSSLAGTEFTYRVVDRSRFGPGAICVHVAVRSGARFHVQRNDLDSRLGKAIGLLPFASATRVPAGGAAFDDAFVLQCDSIDTGRLFSSPRNRDAVRLIFEQGYEVLVHDGKVLAATRRHDPSRLTPGAVRAVVPPLAELAAAIRQDAAPPVAARIEWLRRIAVVVAWLVAIGFIPGYIYIASLQ